MRSLIRGLRCAALFVGAVVGAGFATGQEIRLFFGGDGVGNLAIAALFMAVCAFSFLELGARDRRGDPRLALAADTVITLSSFAVYAAMIAAAERVLWEMTGQGGLSILLAVALLFFTAKRIGWVAALNLVAVPLMAAIIVAVGRQGVVVGGETLHPIRSSAYGGMNLLFSGALMRKEGAALTRKERVIASVTSGVTVFLLLFFMYRSVVGVESEEMPFLAAAHEAGVGALAPIALLLAIITTMASCGYLVTDRLTLLCGDPSFAAPAVVLCGVLAAQTGFAFLVRTTYPVISYLGLAASLLALTLGVGAFFRRKKLKKRPIYSIMKKI